MRLRFPELFRECGITPYQLAKRSKGRIAVSTAYRWQQLAGRVKSFDGEVVEDLCDILDLELAQVIELEGVRRRR
jgi:hypothetical protein